MFRWPFSLKPARRFDLDFFFLIYLFSFVLLLIYYYYYYHFIFVPREKGEIISRRGLLFPAQFFLHYLSFFLFMLSFTAFHYISFEAGRSDNAVRPWYSSSKPTWDCFIIELERRTRNQHRQLNQSDELS